MHFIFRLTDVSNRKKNLFFPGGALFEQNLLYSLYSQADGGLKSSKTDFFFFWGGGPVLGTIYFFLIFFRLTEVLIHKNRFLGVGHVLST